MRKVSPSVHRTAQDAPSSVTVEVGRAGRRWRWPARAGPAAAKRRRARARRVGTPHPTPGDGRRPPGSGYSDRVHLDGRLLPALAALLVSAPGGTIGSAAPRPAAAPQAASAAFSELEPGLEL